MAIHFTWKPEWPAVKNVLPMIEAKLAPFDARPHWGKLFTMTASQIKPLYPEMSKYQGLVAHYDAQWQVPQSLYGDQYLRSLRRRTSDVAQAVFEAASGLQPSERSVQ